VTVERRQTEFLDIAAAHRDGREFTLRGHGIVRVRTPDHFRPAGTYEVTTSSPSRQSSPTSVRAGRDGRLTITTGLGRAIVGDQLVSQIEPSGAGLAPPVPVTVRVR
jgi:hypothetical protein